jgi:hypothetical protein
MATVFEGIERCEENAKSLLRDAELLLDHRLFKEGTPSTRFGTSNRDWSYARHDGDTDDNASDSLLIGRSTKGHRAVCNGFNRS